MCSNVKIVTVVVFMHPAVMFMNSNKSEGNIRRIIQENQQKYNKTGIALMNVSSTRDRTGILARMR